MQLDTYQPTFLIEIEGHRLTRDITHDITSFVFEDNEEESSVRREARDRRASSGAGRLRASWPQGISSGGYASNG